MDCVLYEDFTGCVRYELESGAVAMTNISGCDPAALKALTKDAVDLLSAEATVKALGKHSALMLPWETWFTLTSSWTASSSASLHATSGSMAALMLQWVRRHRLFSSGGTCNAHVA
jgi:hypothetical protein